MRFFVTLNFYILPEYHLNYLFVYVDIFEALYLNYNPAITLSQTLTVPQTLTHLKPILTQVNPSPTLTTTLCLCLH